MRLLIVEDDARLLAQLAGDISRRGFAVDEATNLAEALHMARVNDYDALILDRELPDGDGLRIVRALRESGNAVPAMMLTVRDSWQEKVQSLTSGADDYLTKPFQIEELLARVQALIRRRYGAVSNSIRSGSLALNEARQSVTAGNAEVELSGAEFRLLRYFMLNAGRLLSRDALYEHIYDGAAEHDSNVIEVYIGHLRKKLGRDVIQTRRGQGYMLVDEGL